MGRRERPIDRSAGPVAAFADDLRKLRAEAGSPAYAALARRTGYGTSTLADAAAGRRLPTLEVTLAYVGACGGDPVGWEHRWRAVSETLASAPEPAGQDLPDNPGQSRPPWSGRRAALLGGAAALLVAGGAVGGYLGVRGGDEPAPAPAPVASGGPAATGCPPVTDGGVFGGKTFKDGVQVRQGAGRSFPVQGRLPGNCAVRFTGWCVGEPIVDVFEGYPDARWYVLADGTLVASAVILGVPPAGTRPMSCPGARPAAGVSRVTAGSGRVSAAATDAHTVGFAARYRRAGETAPGWHQVAADENPRDGFAGRLPAEAAGAPVVAAACYAPDWPAPAAASSRSLPPAEQDRGQQAACRPWH